MFALVSLCEGFALSTKLCQGVVSGNHVLRWGKAGKVGSANALGGGTDVIALLPATPQYDYVTDKSQTDLSTPMNKNVGAIIYENNKRHVTIFLPNKKVCSDTVCKLSHKN